MLLIRKERSLENQLKSEKFNKNLIHVDSEKNIFNLLKRPKECHSIRAYS